MVKLNQQIKYWDSVAGKKKFTHPLDKNRFQALVPKTASILDMGCGYGRLCRKLYELDYEKVVGIDMSKEMVREGLERFPHLDLQCHISEDIPFQDESFDVVMIFAVLTCTPTDNEQRNLINTAQRMLKPDGLILVSDYFLQNNERYKTRYDSYREKYNMYGTFELDDGAVLRHHQRSWINTLLSTFNQISLEEMEAPTMNGNPSTIFQYWGKKKVL